MGMKNSPINVKELQFIHEESKVANKGVGLGPHVSNFILHMNHLGICYKCKF